MKLGPPLSRPRAAVVNVYGKAYNGEIIESYLINTSCPGDAASAEKHPAAAAIMGTSIGIWG